MSPLSFAVPAFLALILIRPAQAKVADNLDHGLALHGFDPVAYLEDAHATPGLLSFTVTVAEAHYRFASDVHRDRFLKDPARYLPAYGGWCAYAMAEGEKVDVNPQRFRILKGRLYLFYDGFWGNTLAKWELDEANLWSRAELAWKRLSRETP